MKKLENKKLLACCLGDGSLSSSGSFSMLHCAKQKEYLIFKTELLNIDKKRIRKKNNNKFPAFCCQKGTFNKIDNGREIRKKLYGVKGYKFFSEEIVENLDKFCIAILYCDDGSLIPQKSNGKIHAYKCSISTYCSKEECQRLSMKIFELFGVKFNINKDKNKFLLKCGTKEARKFIPQILKEVPLFECFKENKLKTNF